MNGLQGVATSLAGGPVKESEFTRRFTNLVKNTESLEHIIQELNLRLSGVSRAEKPNTQESAKNPENPENSTQLGRDMQSVSDRIALAHRYLGDIISRLEI